MNWDDEFEKIAIDSPFGENSFFSKSKPDDFFDGFVAMLPILYRIGAAMPELNQKENTKGILLEEVIVEAQNRNNDTIFDYKKYGNENEKGQNFWEYWKNYFAGQAILNKKIGYIDTEKIFFDRDGSGFNLYIPYKNDNKVSINNADIEYLKAKAAIKLTQLDTDAFLIILSNLTNSKRQLYVEYIFKKLVSEIEALLKNKEAVEALFDIPIELLQRFKKQTIKNLFSNNRIKVYTRLSRNDFNKNP
jgi:hypothetical protein